MKVSRLLLLALWVFAALPSKAQYKIDWVNAPANPIPVSHTKNHFNLKGDIKSEELTGTWGYTDVFDANGNLVEFLDFTFGDISYGYDSRGHLTQSTSSDATFGTYIETYQTDSRGYVTQWKNNDGSQGKRYVYNGKGLWEATYDLNTGKILEKYEYDAKNRIVKIERHSDGLSTTTYTYAYEGRFNKVTVTTTAKDGKTSSYTDYYDGKGNNMYSSTNVTFVFDDMGNWYEKRNPTSVISTRVLTYFSGKKSGGGTSNVTPNNPNTPNSPNTPSTPSNTDCVSGDCYNGWGKKNFSYGYYEGFWKNGKREGYGLFQWTGSGKYIGFWVNDELHGYGCYLGNDKNMIGEYRNGNMTGPGYTHELKTDKWVYAIFKSYLVETEYTFYTNNVTTGCVAGDCQNKYGRYKWSNGDSFTGFFRNGNMWMGTYTFASGDKYEGFFNSANQFDGGGRFFFKDNSYYGGQWRNGKQEGRGYYHDSSYNRQIGEWSNGVLIKQYN
ncbi:MAG: hypothetical protein R2773_06580 [Flavobacteriaceae bacterium]